MNHVQLQASLKLWQGRERYRKARHTLALKSGNADRIKHWGDKLREARNMILRRERQLGGYVAAPVRPILEHSWGWHPGVHDGVDLITEANDILYAICDGTVIDVRSSGWWGKGARASGGHSVADGDGIIQIRCDVDAGPFKKGMHFGYGHAEQATVAVGHKVKAGQVIGHAGFANAWHVHFMCNGGNTTRGVGDRDPWPFVAYALKQS
jgi:murein DD-endopeptidase MepM/ murein hydrolase activator NlpD